MESLFKRAWAEIDIDNLIHNYCVLKALVPQEVAKCCVIKADAYGHNAPKVAQTLEKLGAEWFAVSNIEEAIQLRRDKITRSILVLGYTPAQCAPVLAEYDISQCVYSIEYAQELSRCAEGADCTVRAHLKFDTGMGRLGFQVQNGVDNALDDILTVCNMNGLSVEGVFTHFAVADSGDCGNDFTQTQYSSFCSAVERIESFGVTFKYKHCANSGAVIDHSDYCMDMVRLGVSLYGLYPSEMIKNKLPLKPVMTLKSCISQVKEIEAGDTVSYGCDFVANKKMKIATVSIGYGDGFWRSNGKTDIPLYVKGQPASIVGRICMDQLMLDVTHIDGVKIGDVVTVFGGDCPNSVDILASANDTINYELICAVGKRVPRIFISNGKVEGVHYGMLDFEI